MFFFCEKGKHHIISQEEGTGASLFTKGPLCNCKITSRSIILFLRPASLCKDSRSHATRRRAHPPTPPLTQMKKPTPRMGKPQEIRDERASAVKLLNLSHPRRHLLCAAEHIAHASEESTRSSRQSTSGRGRAERPNRKENCDIPKNLPNKSHAKN